MGILSFSSRPLRRELKTVPVFMILISNLIGIGLFFESGQILAIAGPGMTILAFGVLGVLACLVMECISEMLIRWPIPNPAVEFVRAFVDRDLALVIGFGYWYTYAITVAALISSTRQLSEYWSQSLVPQIIIFTFLPLLISIINSLDVTVFALVELIGGALKLLIVLALVIFMFYIDRARSPSGSPAPKLQVISDGFQHNPSAAANGGFTALIALYQAVFPYIGVEAVTSLASEAYHPDELRFPAQNIGWIISMIYLLAVFGFVLNVSWLDQRLPQLYREPFAVGTVPGISPNPSLLPASQQDISLPVIAALNSGIRFMPSLINGSLIYCAFSSANTALFIATRAAYGLGQSVRNDSPNPLVKLFSKLGLVTQHRRVPLPAMLASLAFIWTPFFSLVNTKKEGFSAVVKNVQQILISVGSTGCVFVWASLCLAYLRYYYALKNHRANLTDEFERYDRWKTIPEERKGNFFRLPLSWFLSRGQPRVAWLGLFGCLVLVLLFPSAEFWSREVHDNHQLRVRTVSAYLGPAIFLTAFLSLKALRIFTRDTPYWVSLDTWPKLQDQLDVLKSKLQ